MPPVIIIILGLFVVGVFIVLMRAKHSPVQQIEHEYFDRLWILPLESYARWEAELDMSIAGIDGKVGFHSEVRQEGDEAKGPTEKEVAFCKPAGHFFSNEIWEGKAILESVDG